MHDRAVEANRHDRLSVDRLVELAAKEPAEHEEPDDLDRSGGRPRRAADEHETDEDHPGEDRPLVEVRARVTGRGHDRHGLEGRVPDGLLSLVDPAADELGDEEGSGEDEEECVQPEFLVPPGVPLPPERSVDEGEVHPGDEHERNDRPLACGAEGLERARLRREPSCGERRERVCDGLVEAHLRVDPAPAEHGEDAGDGCRRADVEDPEPPRDDADRRRELLDVGTRKLGLEELTAADAEAGSTASARTMIPIPPSHWENWRHMASERESSPTSVRMLAPVVVMPDIASK